MLGYYVGFFFLPLSLGLWTPGGAINWERTNGDPLLRAAWEKAHQQVGPISISNFTLGSYMFR